MQRLSLTREAKANGAAPIEEHAIGEAGAHDREVFSPARSGKIREGGALAHAIDDISWQDTSPERGWRIVVFDGGKAVRHASLEEGAMFGEKRLRRVASNRKRTAATVPALAEIGVTFDATERRSHI